MKDCLSFELWLDEGRPAARSAGALAHAAGCPRCTAALAAERQLESALAAPPAARAPEGFRDVVLARVRAAEAAARAARRSPAARAWEFVSDPIALGSLALALLLLWQGPALWAACSRLAAGAGPSLTAGFGVLTTAGAAGIALPAALHVFTRTDVQVGLLTAELPLLWWAARALLPGRQRRLSLRA